MEVHHLFGERDSTVKTVRVRLLKVKNPCTGGNDGQWRQMPLLLGIVFSIPLLFALISTPHPSHPLLLTN